VQWAWHILSPFFPLNAWFPSLRNATQRTALQFRRHAATPPALAEKYNNVLTADGTPAWNGK